MSIFKKGFTLVELSVVLMIIGIIALSVIGGSTLVSTAKATVGLKEVKEYSSLFSVYRSTFGYLPGDSPNPNNTSASDGGNTDGFITWGCNVASCTYNEALNAWYHLSLSGLMTSTFASSGPTITLATNVVVSNKTSTAGAPVGNAPTSTLSSGAGYLPIYVYGSGTTTLPTYAQYITNASLGVSNNANILLIIGSGANGVTTSTGAIVPTSSCTASNFCGSTTTTNNVSASPATFLAATSRLPMVANISTRVAGALDRKLDDGVNTTGVAMYADNGTNLSFMSFNLDALLSQY